jgi:prophage maintenance system killer protein
LQTPKFLSISQVIGIHQDQIISFGGTAGIRDEGLLDSALALSDEETYNLVIRVVQRGISKEELSASLELHLRSK